MRTHLLQFFRVCCVTVLVLAPALLVSGLIWQHHLEFLQSQQLALILSSDLSHPIASSGLSPSQETLGNLILGAALTGPLGFCLGLVWSDGYRTYRKWMHRKQVEVLERLWQRPVQY